jgi:hypothetical protein
LILSAAATFLFLMSIFYNRHSSTMKGKWKQNVFTH